MKKSLHDQRYPLFQSWVEEGYSVRQLSLISKLSRAVIKRSIRYWLQQLPPDKPLDTSAKYLVCDGTVFKDRIGTYAAMNAVGNQIVHAEYDIRENGGELFDFYNHLAQHGLVPKTATIDGNPQQIKYLSMVWPVIRVQRCIVHVQRQGLQWCRRHPKRTDAKHLRQIFLQLSYVSTISDAKQFIATVHAWEKKFGSTIDRSTDRGWVFSDLMKARSMLLKALPNMFHFVRNHDIPKSTNALEGFFSRLKDHYHRHRGLSPAHREAFLRWYIYFHQAKNSNTK